RHAVLCCDKSPAPRRRTAMSTTGTTPRTRAQREPAPANAGGLLVALAVVGRTIESFENTEEALGGTLYMALYSFHMAAFIMISGFLSRSYRNEPRQVRRLLTAMVVPYVIFQMVHEIFKAFMLGRDLEMQLILPAWTLWFLVALLGWRLLSPLLRQLRYPLVFAVAISVIMPLEPDIGSDLSVGRMAQRLPCSVLGLVATPGPLDRTRAFRHRWLGGLVLLGVVAVAALLHEDVPASIFFLRSGYEDERSI